MAVFAILVNNDGYKKYAIQAAKEAGASVPRIKQGIEKRLFELHNAEPLNRKFELPLKWIWYLKCIDPSVLGQDDEHYFVFYESFHMTYSRKFLRYLKKKYKKSKLIFFFTNPAGEYNLGRLKKIRDLYDAVFTFNEDDAKQYGFTFDFFDLFKLPAIKPEPGKESDLFFIGANKGRLPLLLSIFEKMQSAGLKCDFWITDVPAEQQKYADIIHYNQKLSYEEVLQHDCNSKCILEILQDGKQYLSIRTMEALQYHKKLLTTNEGVKNTWFYQPDIIRAFQIADEIDADFVVQDVDDAKYEGIDIGSFQRFVEFLLSEFPD